MSCAVETVRLFFALWPDNSLQAKLAAWAQQSAGRGRAVRRENLHLTLVFLGATNTALVSEIISLAAQVRLSPISLLLDRLGYWKHNRIIWCGGEEPQALAVLVGNLRARLAAAGIHYDSKPFLPHVTLVRNATNLPATPAWTPLGWEVQDFALVCSTRVEGRLTYRVMQRFPAQAG